MSGAIAVVLGGSRGTGEIDDDSDWDLAVLYRGTLDLGELARQRVASSPRDPLRARFYAHGPRCLLDQCAFSW